MKKVIINQLGFTLFEVMITLFITSILTLFTYPTLLRVYDFYQLNQAMTILQSDLHFVRDFNMGSLETNEPMALRIYTFENRYELTTNFTKEPYLSRQFPKNISLAHTAPILVLTFNTAGNTLQGQSFTIKSKYHAKQIVFSIGTGGFDIRDPD